MIPLPSGTITFLFTDVVGSTQLWEKNSEAMQLALAEHDSILKKAIESNSGQIVKKTGDGVLAVFTTAIDALKTVVAAQRMLLETSQAIKNSEAAQVWPLQVRMGLHTGEAELRGGDYYGQALNRAARIMSISHGGQVLLSDITAQVAREHLPEEITFLDLGEQSLRGFIRAEHVFQVVSPGLQKEFPALLSTVTITNNLPTQLTSFIGRERELREAREILFPSGPGREPGAQGARLLTLIGPGGTGKTRLSLQLAADILPKFADGVWFIELAALADPELILQTIGSVVNVRAQIGMPLREILIDFLRAKNLLLILDNCEHLVEACAQLADELLRSAPALKIIASSREALGINGEKIYRVPSLSSPDQEQDIRAGVEGFESIQLFVDRARSANPKFELTDKNQAFVAQICRRLDGIPLALELAAARVTVFSPEQIAARLDDRFKLLTGGSRTAMPRQQTLRALIDWSYDMLSEDERTLLRRLSVFSGGWAFEAAESTSPELDVLNVMSQLVNKSLVTMDEESREPRYRLLETVRQYARDKLLESGEAAEYRNRHLAYTVQLTERAELELFGSTALNWVEKLEAEHDNLRTAFEWGMEQDLIAVLRMGGALPYYWYRRGYETEARKWIQDALERIEALPGPEGEAARRQTAVIAKAWMAASFMASSQGDTMGALAAAEKCGELARQIGDKRMLATVFIFGGSTRMMSGNSPLPDETMDEILAIARESDDPFALGMAMSSYGLSRLVKGEDITKAHQYMADGLALLKDLPNRFGYTMSLFGMAMVARFQGRFDEARERFTDLLPIFQEMGDRHRTNMVYSEMAHMERLEGHYEKAVSMYRDTIREWNSLGHRAAVANQLECFAFIAKIHEQSERSVTLLGAAEALREKIKIPMSQIEQIEYDREVADLKANLDENEFKKFWAAGRALSMDQALAFALNPS
jgi:predicted ATPase/class 3 adenylate cyclase